MILDSIKKQNDIKRLNLSQKQTLAQEIRQFIIDKVSVTGGHLASNLGVVELTIALHSVLNFPEDVLIFDVGHQSYTHKILTGRKDEFDTLRQYEGLSGFPKRAESECDTYDSGHSSSSISAALGYAHGRDLLGKSNKVACVIGDGAMTGGLAFEALNNVSALKSNLLIVLNDNEMSISENVGGLSSHFSRLRTSKGYTDLKGDIKSMLQRHKYGDMVVEKLHSMKRGLKQMVIPDMIFEDLGIMYLGPVDGHDIDAMTRMFKIALDYEGPVVVHVITQKGKGFAPAEKNPARFHGVGSFDKKTGMPTANSNPGYTDVFSTVMKKLGESNDKVVAVTAAMKDNTGLKRFASAYPDRCFDVGIAEGHSVTFAAGLALQGLIPVVAVYSSFLQRAYDEIMMDVCAQHLHVVFAIDRAGLVGSDGQTHQGSFDLAYMLTMPGMVVMAPKNKWELSDMMKFAVSLDCPVAVRYPRGEAKCILEDKREQIELGKSEPLVLKNDSRILLFALGSMVEIAINTADILEKENISVDVVNARFACPLDEECLKAAAEKYDLIVAMEEGSISGGFAEHVAALLMSVGYKGKLLPVAIPKDFIAHGSVSKLFEMLGMDAESIAKKIKDNYIG